MTTKDMELECYWHNIELPTLFYNVESDEWSKEIGKNATLNTIFTFKTK